MLIPRAQIRKQQRGRSAVSPPRANTILLWFKFALQPRNVADHIPPDSKPAAG